MPAAFDLLLPSGVDLLVLNDAPLELAGRVALHGELLFDDDPVARARWVATMRKIYANEQYRLLRAGNASSRRQSGVIDETRALRLLRSVTDDLAVLAREADADEQRRADPLWLRGVKYTFVTAIEACVDVAQHLCASEGWGPPKDNGDAMAVLGSHAGPAADMRRAVGSATLVHGYVAGDGRVVFARLAD